jgi:hypothetical protein
MTKFRKNDKVLVRKTKMRGRIKYIDNNEIYWVEGKNPNIHGWYMGVELKLIK